MSNNLYNNGNVSHTIADKTNTQNSSVNSSSSLEGGEESEFFSGEILDESGLENPDSYKLKDYPNNILGQIKSKNDVRLVIAHTNINFLVKKFDPPLASLVKDKVDILLVSETKLDDTFPLN